MGKTFTVTIVVTYDENEGEVPSAETLKACIESWVGDGILSPSGEECVEEWGIRVTKGDIPDCDLGKEEEETVECSLCGKPCNAKEAHLHNGDWIGDECCWDDRLHSSE